MYVYGGMSGAGITNEMWWFDLSINYNNFIQKDKNGLVVNLIQNY